MSKSPLEGKRIGIIGAGVMGGALARGLINADVASPDSIFISDPHTAHLTALNTTVGVQPVSSNAAVVESSDIVILAVKPQTVHSVLVEIGERMTPDQLLISIAAGVRIETLEAALDQPVPVIRAMPNTAAQVNTGACAYC